MQDKYINPFTDFGFKKLFGEEPNKDLLISFLNTLLPDHHQIKDLSYTRNEHQGVSSLDRKAIFDINCISPTGERFIVELQKAKQNFFKDRSVFYATFPIQEQAQRGDWNYQLSAVYTIGILDFVFDEDRNDNIIHTIKLKDQENTVFYDKLTFIYLTLPHFTKTLDELETLQDKWFYIFRHLHKLDGIPEPFNSDVFLHLFEVAEIACFEPNEQQAYLSSLKYYRDLQNVVDSAWDEGKQEGLEEGKSQGIEVGKAQGLEEGKAQGLEEGKVQGLEEGKAQGLEEAQITIAKNLLDVLDNKTIALKTGLSVEQIEALR